MAAVKTKTPKVPTGVIIHSSYSVATQLPRSGNAVKWLSAQLVSNFGLTTQSVELATMVVNSIFSNQHNTC